MRLHPLAALALTSSLAAQTALKPHPPEPSPAESALPITRVALYKNGVGYFEHAGRVTGDQSVTIDFTSAQLNDVLQSLTAIDLNGGRISGAGYNSTLPLDQQLKTLPLALDSDPTDTSFYNAIRGARVKLSQVGATSFTGRLLSIDLRDTTSANHRFVTVVSDAGQVRTVELTPAVSVTLLDTALHTDVTKYLELLASTRNQGLRHLSLLDRGTGNRDLRVSYISEVPVWKSTYRILFTESKQASDPTATVQGWSVVDNTTGTDWTNVHLDLIAGAPQSFIQPLSVPYYARRPEIGMPSEAQLAPQTHDSGELSSGVGPRVVGTITDPSGAIVPNATVTVTSLAGQQFNGKSGSDGRFSVGVGQPGQYSVRISMPGFSTYAIQGVNVGSAASAPLQVRLPVASANETVSVTASDVTLSTESASMAGVALPRSSRMNRNMSNFAALAPGVAPPPPPIADFAEAAQASIAPQTNNTAFDDFFQYSITDPITIRKNESALVPILQTKLPIERVTLWSTAHPVALRALWLTNASALTLDRGSFSIVENGNFGGEGLLDPIHPGERRLLSYAADQAIHIDAGSAPQQHHLRSIVIAKGTLTESFRDVTTRDYTIRNAAPEARTVVLEHTRSDGYELASTDTKPDETLPNAYRYRVPVPAGQTVHLKVSESRGYLHNIEIESINDEQIAAIVLEMGSAGDTKLRDQLKPVLDAQAKVAELDAKKTAVEERMDGLDTEEQRQRANIATLKDADKSAQKRYVDQLGKIEDQILDLQKQQETLNNQLEAAKADLANKVEAVQFSQTLEP